jgi:hypothetical protein
MADKVTAEPPVGELSLVQISQAKLFQSRHHQLSIQTKRIHHNFHAL